MSLAAAVTIVCVARASGGAGAQRRQRDEAGAMRLQQAREVEVRGERTSRRAASAGVTFFTDRRSQPAPSSALLFSIFFLPPIYSRTPFYLVFTI